MEIHCPLRSEEDTTEEPVRDGEENESEIESMSSDNDTSLSDNHDDDNSEDNSENSTEEEEPENEDPWELIKDQAKRRYREQYEEPVDTYTSEGTDRDHARIRAYKELLPTLRKEARKVYLQYLIWIQSFKKDPVHKKIMETKRNFISLDEFDEEEATEAAVAKRKFLLNKLFTDDDYYKTDEDEDV